MRNFASDSACSTRMALIALNSTTVVLRECDKILAEDFFFKRLE